jgi:hypothetical protein
MYIDQVITKKTPNKDHLCTIYTHNFKICLQTKQGTICTQLQYSTPMAARRRRWRSGGGERRVPMPGASAASARAATRSEEPAGRRRGASTVARRDGSSAARARAATRWCGWVPCRRLLSVPRTSIIDGSSAHEPKTKRGQGCLCKFFLLWWEDLFTKCLVWLAWILRKHGSTAHLQSM